MIIYGSNATEILTERISNKCPNCETPNSVQLSVFQKYAHVFWIPFFPFAKTGETQCSHCRQVLSKKEFPGTLAEKYEAAKAKSKTPFWTFSGLVVLAVLITWGIISGKLNDAKNAQMILAPQKGDVYEVKNDYNQYTLYKVESVIGDTVFILIHEYETNKISGLSDLRKLGDEGYGEDVWPMMKSDLKAMLDNGEIRDIERK